MKRVDESPVGIERARHLLGDERPCECGANPACDVCGGRGQWIKPLSRSYLTAVRKAMGVKGRYFFVSDVRQWLRRHPDWKMPSRQLARDTYGALLAEALPVVRAAGKFSLVQRIESKLQCH
jgi:hypothetical protein